MRRRQTIDLVVEQNVLMIKAERRFEAEEGDEWIAAERPHGTFSRQLFLGETLDAERMEANYEAGVLKLRIPGAESAKPRKVMRPAPCTLRPAPCSPGLPALRPLRRRSPALNAWPCACASTSARNIRRDSCPGMSRA
jgi:hypothetical protein